MNICKILALIEKILYNANIYEFFKFAWGEHT